MRALVITDNEGVALEVINTSMEDKEIADFALSLVKQMLEHRRLLGKNGNHQQTQVAQEQTQSGRDTLLEQKLAELAKYSLEVAKQAGNDASKKYKSMAKSVANKKLDLFTRCKIAHYLFLATETETQTL